MVISKLEYTVIGKTATIIEIASIFAVVISYYVGVNTSKWIRINQSLLYVISCSFLILVCSQEQGKISRWLANSKLAQLNKYTLEFYLIHYVVIRCFMVAFTNLSNTICGSAIEIFLIFIITSALSLIWKQLFLWFTKKKVI
jgi:peptidoglycan/LPS O-acetylase OafA/YrhL